MVKGVSLGPGDPELLTLKGLKALLEADIVYYPGSISKGVRKSYVLPILTYHGIKEEVLRGFFLNMDDDRTQVKKVYEAVAQEIVLQAKAGKQIVIVCEGDLSLYASFSYILAHLQAANTEIELIPGVNSFSLAASQHQIPLSLLNDTVGVLPRVKSLEIIKEYFEKFDTLILMKVKTNWNEFYEALVHQQWQLFYAERLGTAEEFITTDIRDLMDREIPYFSLLILKK